MLNKGNILYLHKFGKKKYMDLLQQGKLSFSALGSFVDQAIITKNQDQGDENEGVFARLRIGDPRILEASKMLQNDLEIIKESEGTHVKLRRYSSHFIPVFCIYGLSVQELESSNEFFETGWKKVKLLYDNRMYSGFADSFECPNVIPSDAVPSQLIIQSEIFKYLAIGELARRGLGYRMGKVNYTELDKDEFYIDPSNGRRDELFHKTPYYNYQKEVRICLPDIKLKSVRSRFEIALGEIQESHVIVGRRVYPEFTVRIGVETKV